MNLKDKLVLEKFNKLQTLKQPKVKEKKTTKWTVGVKLSLLVGATAYILACYKPYDVRIEGDIHYYMLSKDAVSELNLSGKEIDDLESGVMKLIQDLPLAQLGATPKSVLTDLSGDTISGLASDFNQLKTLVSSGFSIVTDYFNNNLPNTLSNYSQPKAPEK